MLFKQIIKFINYAQIPFKFSKKYSILLLVSGITYSLIFNCSIYILSIIIDKIKAEPLAISNLIISLFFYLLCMGLMFVITNTQSFFQKNLKSLAYIKAKNELYTKKFTMKYSLNEDAKVLDTFNLLDDFDDSIVDLIKSLVFFVTLFFQLLFLIFLICIFSVPTAFLICIFTILILIIVLKGGTATYEANKKVQPIEREKKAIENVLVDFSYAEERNLFNFNKFLTTRFYNKALESRKYTNKALALWFFKAQYGGIIFIILTLIVTFLLVSSLLREEITFGLFIALFSAFIQLSDLMSWDLSDNVDSFIKSMAKNKDYIDFMLLEDNPFVNEKRNSLEDIYKIKFKNVYFSYPQSSRLVLENINLEFENNKKYAIVGENGCGKTTLFKLLLGLYSNYDGKIEFYSKNDKLISHESFMDQICIVFQDFSKYFISIRDFLELGQKSSIDYNEILQIFHELNIGINIDILPNGIDTLLGNIIDEGTNISGGQWQKLCLARAILSRKSIVILDEPTSSIDPISELQIIKKFESLCSKKTLIYITHRLVTVKNADKIMVLRDGKIVEKGNHNYLISLKGLYNHMFETQKNWYKNEFGGDIDETKN